MWTVPLCYSGTVWEPITQIGGADKGPLPLVQMSKAFMKIPNVIQPDPTNKDLLYFTQIQSESLWLRLLLSPSLLIDNRETADCGAIITKCLVISIRKPRFITCASADMVQSSVRTLSSPVRRRFHGDPHHRCRAQMRVHSYSGLLTLSFFLGAAWHNGDSLDWGAVKAVKLCYLVQPSGHTYFFSSSRSCQTTTDPWVIFYFFCRLQVGCWQSRAAESLNMAWSDRMWFWPAFLPSLHLLSSLLPLIASPNHRLVENNFPTAETNTNTGTALSTRPAVGRNEVHSSLWTVLRNMLTHLICR